MRSPPAARPESRPRVNELSVTLVIVNRGGYASPEEIPELQRPRRATGNRRNLQCGDDSIMRANATRDTGSPCLGAVGPWSGGSALLVVDFSVLVSILLCSLSMSGAVLST